MKNQEIYTAALRLIGEPSASDQETDYTERAPYILANFISDNRAANKQYCLHNGLSYSDPGHPVYVPLEHPFPLCERFAPAAQFYLAYLLISEENTSLGDMFFDRYCDAISSIFAEIPALREKIVNAYTL